MNCRKRLVKVLCELGRRGVLCRPFPLRPVRRFANGITLVEILPVVLASVFAIGRKNRVFKQVAKFRTPDGLIQSLQRRLNFLNIGRVKMGRMIEIASYLGTQKERLPGLQIGDLDDPAGDEIEEAQIRPSAIELQYGAQ